MELQPVKAQVGYLEFITPDGVSAVSFTDAKVTFSSEQEEVFFESYPMNAIHTTPLQTTFSATTSSPYILRQSAGHEVTREGVLLYARFTGDARIPRHVMHDDVSDEELKDTIESYRRAGRAFQAILNFRIKEKKAAEVEQTRLKRKEREANIEKLAAIISEAEDKFTGEGFYLDDPSKLAEYIFNTVKVTVNEDH